MLFMTGSQYKSGQLEGISLRIVMCKYEDNPLTNNKIIAKSMKNLGI